jgi:3',5'-cyclic-AMP phosphodiesterase
MSRDAVTFVWPGDLHLDVAGRDNHTTALWMADEVSSLIRPDFVQFAGDNVQHARDSEWALFEQVTSRLTVPWHALVGDHDAHHDPGCHAYQARLGATYKAYTVNGIRFICLNSMQMKPLGMTAEQVLWFRYEVDGALQRGERVVVFQHHYPFQIMEDFGNAQGMAAWRKIMQTRPIAAVFSGHTHYGQMANDAKNVYIATRSIGEPEGGPAGYAIVTIDDDTLAIVYRSVEDRGPVVQITSPRRQILATTAKHIVTGPMDAQVRLWSSARVVSVEGRVDGGEWVPYAERRDGTWHGPVAGDALVKGSHSLEVRATDDAGTTGRDFLVFASDLTGRYNPVPAVDPVVTTTKFC